MTGLSLDIDVPVLDELEVGVAVTRQAGRAGGAREQVFRTHSQPFIPVRGIHFHEAPPLAVHISRTAF